MKRFRIEISGQPRRVERDGGWRLLEGELFGVHQAGDPIRLGAHGLLAPIEPSKIVAVGLNYRITRPSRTSRFPRADDLHQALDVDHRPRRCNRVGELTNSVSAP
jgi:hypothetical protein